VSNLKRNGINNANNVDVMLIQCINISISSVNKPLCAYNAHARTLIARGRHRASKQYLGAQRECVTRIA